MATNLDPITQVVQQATTPGMPTPSVTTTEKAVIAPARPESQQMAAIGDNNLYTNLSGPTGDNADRINKETNPPHFVNMQATPDFKPSGSIDLPPSKEPAKEKTNTVGPHAIALANPSSSTSPSPTTSSTSSISTPSQTPTPTQQDGQTPPVAAPNENQVHSGSFEAGLRAFAQVPVAENANNVTTSPTTTTTTTTTQTQQAVQAAPAAAPNAVEELKKIRAKAISGESSDDASQKVIKELMTDLKNIPGYKPPPHLRSDLATTSNNQFEVEPYKLGDKTCYRIQATYTVEAEVDGKIVEIPFTRTISTNAETPEEAIKIASRFKHHVSELAKMGVEDMESEYDGADADFHNAAANSRSLSMKFTPDPRGQMSHLASISVSKGSSTVSHDVKTSQQYVYDAKSKKYKGAVSSTDDMLPKGHVHVHSEEEALLYERGYSIKTNPEFYRDLQQKDKGLQNHIDDIKKAIGEKEKIFDQLKDGLMEEPVSKYLRRAKEPTFNETDRIHKEGEALTTLMKDSNAKPDTTGLSENMQNFVSTNEKLVQLNENVKKSEKELVEYGNEIEVLDKAIKKLEGSNEESINFIFEPFEFNKLNIILKKHGFKELSDQEVNINACKDLISEKKKNIEAQSKDLPKEIAELKVELKDLQEKIAADQVNYNKKLAGIQKVNNELKALRDQLKQINTWIATEPATRETEKISKNLQKSSKELDDKIIKNELKIARVVDRLGKIGAGQGDPKVSAVFVASDVPSAGAPGSPQKTDMVIDLEELIKGSAAEGNVIRVRGNHPKTSQDVLLYANVRNPKLIINNDQKWELQGVDEKTKKPIKIDVSKLVKADYQFDWTSSDAYEPDSDSFWKGE